MTKKIMLALIFLLTSAAAIGCGLNTTATTTTTTETTTTTTGTTTTATTLDPTSLAANIPAECEGVEIVNGWVPTWCEEFNYTGAVNPTKWRHQTGGGGYGNNELQNYTSRAENAFVDGEKLIITALKESYGGNAYTSAKIWTQGLFNWKYGKFEMRAKLPSENGTWPAFWMMPKLSVYGGWPHSGEIDILEQAGTNLNTAVGSIHTGKYNWPDGTQISFSRTQFGLTSEFHTYSITWNEYSISWYVDTFKYGTTTFSASANTDVETAMAWPFDQEFYLILNLAMGGNMGGTIGADFVSDTLEIDYVRVYQKDFVTGDTQNPGVITQPVVLRAFDSSAYVIWTKATDNLMVRRYNIYVDGTYLKSVSLNTVKLNNLTVGQEYLVEIEAEDYAGNLGNKVPVTVETVPAD